MPHQIFEMKALESADLSYNQISVWVLFDDLDYEKCALKTLDVSLNVKLK